MTADFSKTLPLCLLPIAKVHRLHAKSRSNLYGHHVRDVNVIRIQRPEAPMPALLGVLPRLFMVFSAIMKVAEDGQGRRC